MTDDHEETPATLEIQTGKRPWVTPDFSAIDLSTARGSPASADDSAPP